jgi:hypothetical protein
MKVWIPFSQGSVWETFLFLMSVKDLDHETSYKCIILTEEGKKNRKTACVPPEAERSDLDT